MARDRQRAKQRRAARRAAAPSPLEHSSAEVDEARLAEAGAEPPDDGEAVEGIEIYEDELHDDDEPVERAPDAVEGDAVSARDRAHAEHPRRKRGRVLTFLGHCVDELRRVQWPNRRQVGQATAVVLGFVVIAGGYLGLLDAIWRPLIEAIL
jgi:preprotein translocase SecE subunit